MTKKTRDPGHTESTGMDSMAARTQEGLDAGVEDAREFARRGAEWIDKNQNTVGDTAHRVADKVGAQMESARHAFTGSVESTMEVAEKAWTASENYVKDKPWKAMAMAVGAGFVLGAYLIRRR